MTQNLALETKKVSKDTSLTNNMLHCTMQINGTFQSYLQTKKKAGEGAAQNAMREFLAILYFWLLFEALFVHQKND